MVKTVLSAQFAFPLIKQIMVKTGTISNPRLQMKQSDLSGVSAFWIKLASVSS